MTLLTALLLNTAVQAAPAPDEADVQLPPLDGFFIPMPEELASDPYRIWNGKSVPSDEHPAVVALATPYGKSLFVFCSGSLITPEWVLTAAHCIDTYPQTIVVFGGNLLAGDITDMVDASEVIPHPDYDAQRFRNDIGLVRLGSPKTDVAPVALRDEAITSEDHGRTLTIMGFGITYDGGGGSGIKRKTQAPIVDHNQQYVITYDPDTNVCQGDSGGPAFESVGADLFEQVGVNAYVTPGCVGGAAGLTRVDRWIPWILDYAPDTLLEAVVPKGSPDEPEPPKVLSAQAIDRDLGEVPTPGDYPVGMSCQTAAGGTSGALFLGALLAVGRRRRSA